MKVLAVFLKELVDLLRDRRALISGLLYAGLGPVVVLIAVNMLAAQTREESLSPIRFCGARPPAVLVEHLTLAGLVIDANASICLTAPEDFEVRLRDGRTARVQIRADLTTSGATVRRVETELRRFSSGLGAQRLLARGEAPSVSNPISVDTQSTNNLSRQADVIARILIILFVSAPFFVSTAAAADMTAGERERRSLEPLLAHPVGALSLVVGKWAAATSLGILGTAACVVGGLAVLDHSALPELGIRLETELETGVAVSILLIPLTMLISAAQIAVGLWSRNFKDAQSYLTLMSLIPVVAGFVLTGETLSRLAGWPMAWELGALAGPLLHSTTSASPFYLVSFVELVGCAGVLVACARRLRNEAILSHG